MNMKNLQPQAYIKNNKIHKKSHRRFWGSACLFLSIFLLPVSVTATSAVDDESIFVSSDADAPSPDPVLRHLIPVLRHLILMIQLLTWTAFFQAMAPTILPGITPSMSSLRMKIFPTNQTQERHIQSLIQQVTKEETVLRAHPLARLFSISHSFSLKTAIFPASPYRPEVPGK